MFFYSTNDELIDEEYDAFLKLPKHEQSEILKLNQLQTLNFLLLLNQDRKLFSLDVDKSNSVTQTLKQISQSICCLER